jgi:glucose/arabinose dehydrogenase
MRAVPTVLFTLIVSLACVIVAARAADDAVRVGTAAYGDWRSDAPGVKRLIRPADMPQPYASGSARNGARIVPQPRGPVPRVPTGFAVTALASGFEQPRQLRVAPNGDLFIAESGADRIRLIRASETHASVFIDGLSRRPFGIAFYPPGPDPQFIYIATEGEVLRYAYRLGATRPSGRATVIVPDVPVGHHWTRDIAFTPDGKKLLLAVGSADNDGEAGMQANARRADILEYNPDGTGMRIFASGLRNPVSIAFYPGTNDLWTTVNERDGLGDNLPPDYVTRVRPGGFYGWPWFYIGGNPDPRHKNAHPELRDSVVVPDVLIQAHSAPLGLAVYTGTQFPESYRGDIFVALHGSWNRSSRTGYKVIRIPVRDGKPSGGYEDFMTGFVVDASDAWGRPVGVAVAADGALLVSDDGSGTVWRIVYDGKTEATETR